MNCNTTHYRANSSSVPGDPTAARARAAQLFEEGVRQFEGQEFAAAAHTFLSVDELLPSSRALSNALSAARRAGLHLLVIETVERAKARTDIEPEARKLFDRALVDATRNLARIDATCRPAPCTVKVDGALTNAARYVEAGDHVVLAEGSGARSTRTVPCGAGAVCAVDLVLEPPREEPTPPAVVAAPVADRTAPEDQKPLSPWVFVASAAVTAGLAGVTVWSGLDAVAARDRHPPESPEYDPDDIHARARRTDVLLVGTGLALGATAVVGLFFVDWSGKTRASASWLPGGGAFVAAAQEF